jgi:acyl-coenzyme A synthetase/AMP-(fatty) acid ligase
VQYIVDEVHAPLVLSDMPHMLAGKPVCHPLIDGADPPSQGVHRPPGPLGSIVFTSGSTGRPKGIMLAPGQGGFVDYISAMIGLGPEMRVGTIAAGTVAASVRALLTLVGCGWTVVGYEVRRHPEPLGAWLRTARVRGFAVVPTVLRQILGALGPGEIVPDLQLVGVFGEGTTWQDVRELRSHLRADSIIFNAYGQQEAGSIAVMMVVSDTPIEDGPLPVGRPLPEREVSIVDESGHQVPAGERGEIIVRSSSTALGYWNEEILQSKVFFPQPDGSMIVHTGDVGRFRPDGLLEHLGRLDRMVKVVGNRVDLTEVEVALLSSEDVADAVATTYTNDRGELRIRAFVVPVTSRSVDTLELRTWLAGRLPRSALPDAIEAIGQIPKLPNGKADRNALVSFQSELEQGSQGESF